jgi:hypothetical protein
MNFDPEPGGLVAGAFLGSERKQLHFVAPAAVASTGCRSAFGKPVSTFISLRYSINQKREPVGVQVALALRPGHSLEGESEGPSASKSVPVRKIR